MLDRRGPGLYLGRMTPRTDPDVLLQDHTRLSERFFGAARAVLARP